ncbi:hypothetical protein Tco_0940792 [Tanacetum coccineum]|uniref:Reverse transcriptase domain-containing protein n=1 Tax=Tanacetum coccineum TaxID=301880 RepID=A0ABQ5DPQ3_9ASTR
MPKEILVAEAGKFKPPPPMVTPPEKKSINKFCDFHNEKGHSTAKCMQLKRQIEELWGDYMAARTVKALGNYRRRRALYKRMDELYDSKVAVSLQWYNRKTQNKGNPSGAIYRSRDAYVPSHKRDSYYP